MSTSTDATSISAPYTAINNQNQSLQKFVSGIGDYYSLERNQFNRKNDTLPILGYIKNGLLLLYAVVFLVLVIVFFMKGQGLSIYMKIGLIIGFALYPFIIYPAENALYQLYYYTYSVIYGESYESIMSRKGLQNPKNFKDITNLSYYIGNFASITRNFAMELRDRISQLPDILQPGFSKLQGIVKDMPDKAQEYLINLQNDIITIYEETKHDISKLKSLDEIKSTLEKFKTEVQSKITGFWGQINDISFTDQLKNLVENAITNLQLQLNIQMYLQQMPDIFKTLYQQNMSTIPDEVKQQALILYQDWMISYQDFKSRISSLTDTNQINSAITDLESIIKNKNLTFIENVKNIDLPNDAKASIKNGVTEFLMQLNIQISLDQLQSVIPNSSSVIKQKFVDLQTFINTSIQNQYNDLIQKQTNKFSNEEINGIIIKYTNDINNKIQEFMTSVKQSGESININIDNLKLFCTIAFYRISDYLYYFIYQIKTYSPTNITITDDMKQMLYTFESNVNDIIYYLQTNIYSADTNDKIVEFSKTAIYALTAIYVKLILDINNLSTISIETKNYLQDQITDKANIINTYIVDQYQKYNTLSAP